MCCQYVANVLLIRCKCVADVLLMCCQCLAGSEDTWPLVVLRVSKIKAKSSQPPSSLSLHDATPGVDQSASTTAGAGSSGAHCTQMHSSGVAATVSLFLEKCKGQVVLIKDMLMCCQCVANVLLMLLLCC
jgi:hypothetical protein